MRANTNISLKSRLQLQLTDFKGVDFSSSPLRVQQNRASDMTNFINEYGVNRKRNGWKELFRLEGNINGIFPFQKNNEIIVHAGTKFYRVTQEVGQYTPVDITKSSTYTPAICDTNLLKDQKSQAFYNQGKMYIIGCGDYLVYGSWNEGETYELRRVFDNEDTYIPTTTISIDNENVIESSRASLDGVNILSPWRINQLLGCSDSSDNPTGARWRLDAKVQENSDVEVIIETFVEEKDEYEVTIKKPVTYVLKNTNEEAKNRLYIDGEDGEIEGKSEGVIVFEEGIIALFIDTLPEIEGRDNIFVKFKPSSENQPRECITKCNFGTLFGVEGNTDRLFLSGNPDYPNMDFHSEMDDYTYFGETNIATMGSDAVAVKGYARLSDSTLVIYKEESGQEASIFYRTGKYQETESNGVTEIRGIFPTTAGSVGEGVVSGYACANLAGDNLFLSSNGVFGVVLGNNVATNERYMRERSRSINERLKRHSNLSDAVGIVFKNRYYLAVDGVCYVADSRFKYSSSDDIDGSYNYEWWFWDNIPARVWANIDNQLYFGTSEGRVCVFDNEYTDRTYLDFVSGAGDITISSADNKITFDEKQRENLSENDIIEFSNGNLYAMCLNNEEEYHVEKNRIYTSKETMENIRNGMEVYALNVDGSGLSRDTKYLITDVDLADNSFALVTEDNKQVELLSNSFALCEPLTNKEFYITDLTDATFRIKKTKNSTVPIDLVLYKNSTNGINIHIIHRENVVARWYTPVFDLGTNESSNTLLKMTISTEAEVNGKISFGYETRNASKVLNAKGIKVFSFDNFSFEDFSFITGFASSYSVKVNERNFNFIIFRFISDDDGDCAVNNFTIKYKINKQNKGVE